MQRPGADPRLQREQGAGTPNLFAPLSLSLTQQQTSAPRSLESILSSPVDLDVAL